MYALMWKATRRSTGRYPSGKGPPKGSRGRPESPLIASAEAKSSVEQENTRKALSLLFTSPPFFVVQIPLRSKGAEGFQRASGKPFGRLRRGEILCGTGKYKEGLFLAFHKTPIFCCTNSLAQQGGRRFPKGDRKALWSPPQRRNPLRNRKKKVKPFPCLSQETCYL